MSIEIKSVSKSFGEFESLKSIDLVIETGELLALLGPSGSGKTTLLRIIAGLESADSGQIYFSGENLIDTGAKDRQVGFVFQHYALFRHMTVFDNIAFGLRVKPKAVRLSEAKIKEKVSELLSLIHLDWVADRFPSQLSGGQRQRIALARALAVEPRILLLDEPFGALDSKVRKELRQWLRRFHHDLKITTIFVTHDQEEALEVSDRVVVLNKGEIEQVGTPEEVYHRPANSFVAEFLGDVTLFRGRVDDQSVYVRPHQFEVMHVSDDPHAVHAEIIFLNPAGPLVKMELSGPDEQLIQVSLSQSEYAELKLKKGEKVYVRPKEVIGGDYCI